MKLLRFSAPLTAAVADSRRQTALSVESRAEKSGFAVGVRVFSDYAADPLTLMAPGLPEGADLALLVLPWRIELWANGRLTDEEWPSGSLFLSDVSAEAWRAAGISVTSDPNDNDRANLPLRAPDFSTDWSGSSDNCFRRTGRTPPRDGGRAIRASSRATACPIRTPIPTVSNGITSCT